MPRGGVGSRTVSFLTVSVHFATPFLTGCAMLALSFAPTPGASSGICSFTPASAIDMLQLFDVGRELEDGGAN